MTTLAIKQKLRDGRPVFLVNADHPSSSLVASLRGLGVDAVMIDCEQGSASFVDVEDMTRAARSVGIASIVRVPSAIPWVVERYMMRDIDGVVVPRIDTAEEALAAVDSIRYCAPNNFEEKIVILQVESQQAVDELDGFLAVPSVDAFFLGAVDLAKSLGYPGTYGEPALMSILHDTINRITSSGHTAGMLVKQGDVTDWLEAGVTLLYVHVNDLISAGAQTWMGLIGVKEGA